MKKLLSAIGLVLLVAAGCNQAAKNNQKQSQGQSAQQKQKQQATSSNGNLPQGEKTGWNTYADSQYGFTFQYPKDYALAEKTKADLVGDLFIPVETHFVSGGQKIVSVKMPDNSFPKDTDFQGAFFNVSVNPSLSQQDCQKTYDYDNPGKILNQTQAINGVTFYKGTGGGAATGHQAQDQYYHTYYNGKCFELIEGLRTGGYGASEQIIKQVDPKNVFNRLEQVLSTFKFTSTTSQDQASNSKVYTNSKYGYQFSYPSLYTLEVDNPARIGLTTSPGVTDFYGNKILPDITIEYFQSLSNLPHYTAGMKDVDDYVAQSGNSKLMYNVTSHKDKSGNLIYSFTDGGILSVYTELMPHNGHYYQISFQQREMGDQLTDNEKQVLSTFKFTK